MSKTNFKELKIWQIAKDIAVDMYKITDNTPRATRNAKRATQINI